MRAAPLIPCGRSPMPPVFHRGTTSSAEVNLKSRHRRAREFAPVIVHQHAATENLPRFVFGERVGRRPRARGGGPSRRIVPNRNANLSAMPGRPSPTHPSAAMRSIALPPGLLGTGAITAAIVTGLRSGSGPRPAIPPSPCAPPTSRSSTPATRWSSPSASLPAGFSLHRVANPPERAPLAPGQHRVAGANRRDPSPPRVRRIRNSG